VSLSGTDIDGGAARREHATARASLTAALEHASVAPLDFDAAATRLRVALRALLWADNVVLALGGSRYRCFVAFCCVG
jgi:hypothetical protein